MDAVLLDHPGQTGQALGTQCVKVNRGTGHITFGHHEFQDASKYLNNIVEQDHRAIKKIAQPMMEFKSFRCASILVAGIETMHRIKEEQLDRPKAQARSPASQFYSLAF